MHTTATTARPDPAFGVFVVLDPAWTLVLGGSLCKSMRNLVGASGFEPLTSWSRTMNPRRINSLAMGTQGMRCLARSCYKLRAIRTFGRVGTSQRDG